MTESPSPEKQFLRGPAFLFVALGFAAMYLGVMPAGMIGAACVLLPLTAFTADLQLLNRVGTAEIPALTAEAAKDIEIVRAWRPGTLNHSSAR